MTSTKTRELTISVPVPPVELSKNGRAHHMERHEIFQEHKMAARAEINRQLTARDMTHSGPVQVIATWYASRRPFPDRDNAISRLSPYADAAEDTGLIVNDAQIESYRVVYSLDAANPRVELTFVMEAE
jgi:Holliday junction resolvase RusA-like endonuclease